MSHYPLKSCYIGLFNRYSIICFMVCAFENLLFLRLCYYFSRLKFSFFSLFFLVTKLQLPQIYIASLAKMRDEIKPSSCKLEHFDIFFADVEIYKKLNFSA